MISSKKLIKLAKEWQKLAANKRKRISFSRTNESANLGSCSTSLSSTAEKGHFVVYNNDEMRFEIPLKYLDNDVIRGLFEMAEDEFGLPSNGPITLPCDAVFMEYVISFIQKHPAKDLEKALIMSLATRHCLPCSNLHHEQNNHQSLICSY